MVDIAGGLDIRKQFFDEINTGVQNAINQGQVTGYSPVSLLGSGPVIPTLARDQLAEQARGTDLGNAINVGNLRLLTDQQNYQQRLGQASLQKGVLDTVAGLRGPSNAIRYNYLLNAVGAPTGQQVDPFAAFRNIAQPTDFASVYPGQLPQQRPPQQQQPLVAPQQQGTAGPMTAATSAPAAAVLPSSGVSVQVTPQHMQYAQATFASAPPEATVSPTTGKTMTPADLAAYAAVAQAAPSEAANWLRSNGYMGAADGASVHMRNTRGTSAEQPGGTNPATVLVGEAGRPEVVVGTDFDVIPLDGAMAAGGSVTDGDILGGLGNPFSFETFSPEQVAQTPAIQQTIGNRPGRAFGGTGIDMSIPGTQTQLPFQLNLQRFAMLNPSERDLIAGLYDTPRELGGLGVDWRDVAEQTRRAAPTGSGFSLVGAYG